MPHLSWLGAGSPREDKVLSLLEAQLLLTGPVIVEEKLDGANLGFSIGLDGALRVQNRGQFLRPPYSGQFSRLTTWIEAHRETLVQALGTNLILFGEWCAARHSLDYVNLPDWFLAFDVYDTSVAQFWSTARRNLLAESGSISIVPALLKGETSLSSLKLLLTKQHSRFRNGSLEGIIVRRESVDWLEARAKLVHPDFTQHINEHWSRRSIEWNRVPQCEICHSS